MWTPYEASGNDYVPIELWGRDHWSTMLYLETCYVDASGVVDNRRMRCNPRLHRGFASVIMGVLADGSKYPTRLRDGEADNHDDWSCLEDMVAAGLLEAWYRIRRHGEVFGCLEAKVKLTGSGQHIAAMLRAHKASGKRLDDFQGTYEHR